VALTVDLDISETVAHLLPVLGGRPWNETPLRLKFRPLHVDGGVQVQPLFPERHKGDGEE